MNNILEVATLVVQAVGFTAVVVYLRRIERTSIDTVSGVKKLQQMALNPRTRISTAAIRTGPVQEEAAARRLGRASAARRVVVGGDPDSGLFRRLNHEGDDHE